MKLGVLTNSISRNAGGLFTSVRKLSQSVQKLGVDAHVYSFCDEYTNTDKEVWAPLSIEVFKPLGPSFFPLSKKFVSTVTKSQCDIFHVHGMWLFPSIVSNRSFKSNQAPYVISPRGMLDPWALKNSSFKKKLASAIFEDKHLKNATCLHALCESEAKSMRDYGLTNPIAVIPNGISVPNFTKELTSLGSNVEGQRKKLLFLGRIHPKKGIRELLAAWAKITHQSSISSNWELVIAGWDDGGYEAGLKEQSKHLGIIESVSFVGPKFNDEKDKILKDADAFILPSFSEGLPMSVLEAWAYCLPVVMTEFCNLPEGFEYGAALKAEPNIDSIASALNILFSLSSEELIKIGSNGRNLVEDRFTWEYIGQVMNDVYEWCITGENPPECIQFCNV
ncbi:glycosyltransferase [Vibrio sp. Vb1018]|uniref:glycosyltransferase n=1 Tax=Vibrio sp. Vb1018 TaxID=3074636 RepID=UPI00296515C0|nr:glycosyltransferase [Vibrio sp. Vb1018]MDW1821125.1 glycosyltransferase [Vibrio sp. Vb1018]